MMKKGTAIFLLMQVFFVVLGFTLFFGLKGLKESRSESNTAAMETPALPVIKESVCDFSAWVGRPVDEDAVKETGRPYRILPPGSMATMDYSPERINVHTIIRESETDPAGQPRHCQARKPEADNAPWRTARWREYCLQTRTLLPACR
jgi:hypothetical protein